MLIDRRKSEYEPKTGRDRKALERKKTVLVHIFKYLQMQNYFDSAQKVLEDTGGLIENYDIADNVDLDMIFRDYEDYFEHKFGKKPRMIVKSEPKLPRIGKQPTGIKKKQSTDKKAPSEGKKQPTKEMIENSLKIQSTPVKQDENTFEEQKERFKSKKYPFEASSQYISF